jgi:hypothetical protein
MSNSVGSAWKVVTYGYCTQEAYEWCMLAGAGNVSVMCLRFLLHDAHRFESLLLSDMSNHLYCGDRYNTPCYGNPNQVLKLQLSLEVRANQVTKVWIRIQRQRLKISKSLYSVDRLTQLANFKNLFELNQTILPKDNLFPMDYSICVQI